MAVWFIRKRVSSRGRAPRPSAAASAEAPASPTTQPAERPRSVPPPAAARRRGRLRLSFRRGSGNRALAAPSPACPASPGRPRRVLC
eukprot:scaffold96862_cov62-Phaeocystis_antarctica.AAC.3